MKRRWQDWINLIFGAWLIFSPWLLKYTNLGTASWDSFYFGLAIVFFAVWALFAPMVWEEWVNLILGLWLIIAPWVHGFSTHTQVTWNVVAVGVIVAVLSLSTMVRRSPTLVA
jgi:general stress protein CsbA